MPRQPFCDLQTRTKNHREIVKDPGKDAGDVAAEA